MIRNRNNLTFNPRYKGKVLFEHLEAHHYTLIHPNTLPFKVKVIQVNFYISLSLLTYHSEKVKQVHLPFRVQFRTFSIKGIFYFLESELKMKNIFVISLKQELSLRFCDPFIFPMGEGEGQGYLEKYEVGIYAKVCLCLGFCSQVQ